MHVVVEADTIHPTVAREFKWHNQVDLPPIQLRFGSWRMLREEGIRIDAGRASHGGDFLRLVPVPTGMERIHPGPLKGANRHEIVQQ